MSGTSVSVIVVVSFLISVMAFVASQISAGRSGHVSTLDRLKEENEDLKAKVERLEERARNVQDENYQLMRKLLAREQP